MTDVVEARMQKEKTVRFPEPQLLPRIRKISFRVTNQPLVILGSVRVHAYKTGRRAAEG